MPGRLFLTRPRDDIARHLGVDGLPDAAFSLGADIAPGSSVLVLSEPRIVRPMRWGMIMSGRKNARGRPVMETIVNARSETAFDKSAFSDVRRGVVPCDGWYEWTGKVRQKTRWRIRPKNGALLNFAAIWFEWQGPGGVTVPQVATITCAPNADVRDVHHRMGVILPPNRLSDWLSGKDVPLDPAPDGSLIVEKAPET